MVLVKIMREDSHSKHLKDAGYKGIFFNLGVFQFLSFLRRGIFYTFMINYLYQLMKTVTYTAMLGTFNMIASSLGQNFLWGKISDKYRLRAELIVAGELIAGCTYIIVFLIHKTLIDASSYFKAGLIIIIGLSILEFFWSMSDVGWAALLTDITTPSIRGSIVGALNFIASIGRTIGVIIAGFMYNDGEGFKNGTIFYAVTVLLFIGAILMAFTSKRLRTRRKPHSEALLTKSASKIEGRRYEEKIYFWFLISLVIIILGYASISQAFLLYLENPQGLNANETEMSLILTAWTISGMITSLVAGKLADKIGRIKVILMGLSLAIVTPLLYTVASNSLEMAIFYGFNGVAFWTLQTVGFAFAGDIVPENKRGRFLSRYNAVMALTWGPAGLLIGGPLADFQIKHLRIPEASAYRNTFYSSSLIVMLGTILFILKIARKTRE